WYLTAAEPSRNPIIVRFKDRVDSAIFSPDGRWAAAGSRDSTVQLLNLTESTITPVLLRGHQGRVFPIAFSPDSRWLASGGEDQVVRLWDLTAADPSVNPIVLHELGSIGPIAFSSDGRWLTTALAAFSPDSREFATGGREARLYHLDLNDLISLACST